MNIQVLLAVDDCHANDMLCYCWMCQIAKTKFDITGDKMLKFLLEQSPDVAFKASVVQTRALLFVCITGKLHSHKYTNVCYTLEKE